MSYSSVVASIACFAASLQIAADDWPRWRGPDFNGISKEAGWSTSWPQEGPRQLWKASVGTGFSSIAVSGGRAYTTGNDGRQDTVYCFDANTGAVVWKYSYDAPIDPHYYEGGTSATPTVDDNKTYTIGKRGQVFCFDAATGKVVWSKNLAGETGAKVPEWGFAGSALVEGGLVIFNAGDAGAALDRESGKVVWSNGRGSAGYSSPILFDQGGRRSVLMMALRSIVAVDPKTGRELWQYPWKTLYDVNAADPVITGDRTLVSSGYDHGCALLRVATGGNPALLWQNKNLRNHFSSSLIVGDSVFGFDESELKCLELQSGNVRWTERSLGKGSLMASDGKLIVLGEKGQLVVADASPSAFKPLARAQVIGGKCWTAPVLANGKIYCRNAKGDVVCVDVSGKAN
ncbi:MAG TPA: PQQ-binding-like beta-propeller repeat protein [Candidatus Angelobacter sp.]|nr:PQQ-binding-like beta-propeller repeat protein [Candidatus Angelobacter sp.]